MKILIATKNSGKFAEIREMLSGLKAEFVSLDDLKITEDFPEHGNSFEENALGHAHVSWLDPHKVRRLTVVGSEKMVVYDDVNADARVMVYDKGVTRKAMAPGEYNFENASLGRFENYGEFQLLLRAGDVLIPKLDFVEPLKLECQHFVECIRDGRQPLSGGYDGLDVVQALEAAQQSLARNGARIEVAAGCSASHGFLR